MTMHRIAIGRWWWLLLALLTLAPGTALPAEDTQAERQAVQPYNNAPVWREVRSGQEQFTTVKGVETGVLVQTAGESWRKLRNGPVTQIGGWLLVALVIALFLFYRWKGPIRLRDKPTGRIIERFTSVERFAHWTLAISFCVLAVSGIVMLFGKHVILPVLGYTLFGWLAILCKSLHNFIGPLFIVSTLVIVVMWVKDNLPRAGDVKWILKAGGMLTGEHVPSHRFNAGQKGWFWFGVVGLGIVMGATGLILDFPNFEQGRSTMQQANLIHAIGAVVFISMSFAHIYIGTIGMEGAYDTMRTGLVDEAWAKEHHEDWYNDVKAGKIPASRTASAGAAAAAPQP
jgi:formate dehydrogenase subunit gamma